MWSDVKGRHEVFGILYRCKSEMQYNSWITCFSIVQQKKSNPTGLLPNKGFFFGFDFWSTSLGHCAFPLSQGGDPFIVEYFLVSHWRKGRWWTKCQTWADGRDGIGLFQKETRIPTIHFQVRTVSFMEGTTWDKIQIVHNSAILTQVLTVSFGWAWNIEASVVKNNLWYPKWNGR